MDEVGADPLVLRFRLLLEGARKANTPIDVLYRCDWKGSLEGWWVQKGRVGLAFLP